MTQFEKAKRKNTPSRKKEGLVMSLLLFLGACLYGFSLLTADPSYVVCFDTPYPSYEGVEHNAHFQFPPSAQNIEFDADGDNNHCSIMAAFDMAPHELEIFVGSTLVPSLRDAELYIPDILKDKGWTQPLGSLVGHGTDGGVYDFGQQYVFVDTTDPDRFQVVIVYQSFWDN